MIEPYPINRSMHRPDRSITPLSCWVGLDLGRVCIVAGSPRAVGAPDGGLALLQNRPLFQVICPGYLWTRDKRWLLSRVQRLAGPAGGTGVFCPGWSHQPGQKAPLLSRLVAPPGTKGPTLLSRLVTPTGTKGPFCPGWCYQPGQKAPPRDSSKGSYSLLSHMYYLVELARKPCARQ